MLQLRIYIIGYLLFCGVTLFAQSENQWKLRKNQDGITVHTRASDSSDFRQLRMNVQIKTTLSTVVAIFKNVPGYLDWVYSCSKSEVLKSSTAHEQTYYSESESPWPVSNRDVVMHSVVEQDTSTLVVTSTSKSLLGLKPEVDGNIRVTTLVSMWTLKPLGDGIIDITYFLSMDPGGWVPAWLMNMTIAVGPFKTLVNLKEEVKKDKYASAKFDFIREP